MPWNLEGRYFESCNCGAPCPCTASLDLPADNDRCNVVLAFQVDEGEIDGTDVAGRNVVAIADAPAHMAEGNWRMGVYIDADASDDQVEKLVAVFGGQRGGPMEAFASLTGEMLGLERAPIEFESANGRHTVKVGDAIDLAVDDVIPLGSESGKAAQYANIGHPLGPTLTIGKASSSHVDAFGISYEGDAGFSAPFSWSG